MPKYKITIEYDGTEFVGWQRQENGPSIQSSIEDAIKKITLQKQDENKATYAEKITPRHRKINFNNEVNTVYNQIRAFAPKPSAWFILNNERINIIKCSMKICYAEVSTIINDQFHIGCRNGKIIPQIIQRQGKKSMKIEEFLKGFNFNVGEKIDD